MALTRTTNSVVKSRGGPALAVLQSRQTFVARRCNQAEVCDTVAFAISTRLLSISMEFNLICRGNAVGL
jgi:hypothetical protein